MFQSINLPQARINERSTINLNWLDYNGDKYPDLWIAPHGFNDNEGKPRLLINRRNQTFIDSFLPLPSGTILNRDTHGNGWADYDNDGDKDLFVVTGAQGLRGSVPNYFLVNDNNRIFINKAEELGIDYPLGAGRGTLWLDYNKDALLDVIEFTELRPDRRGKTALFVNQGERFQILNQSRGFNVPNGAVFGVTADFQNNDTQDVLIIADKFGIINYEIQNNGRFVNKTFQLFRQNYLNAREAIVGDFNGDQYQDIFLTRGVESPKKANILEKTSTKQIFARLAFESQTTARTFSFSSRGDLTFDFFRSPFTKIIADSGNVILQRNQIFLGASKVNPSRNYFTLNQSDPTVQGVVAASQRTEPGLYIGFNSNNNKWVVTSYGIPEITPPPDATDNSWKQNVAAIALIINSSNSLSDPVSNFGRYNVSGQAATPVLLIYDPRTRQFVNRSRNWGLTERIASNSGVTGDFDNDKDLDIFLTTNSTYTLGQPIYYENVGGRFVKVRAAITPSIDIEGARYDDFNIGLNTAVADFNLDGFLDIATGANTIPGFAGRYLGTDYNLFKNTPNRNNWLEIDLEGTQSALSAFGAKVYLTSDGVTQYRELTSGQHRLAQDMDRLHFGLADDRIVDNLRVEWLSGNVDEFTNVPVNKLITITENSDSYAIF